MCRLFGLINSEKTNIKYSMLEAPNYFKSLGINNPDGWGISWYDDFNKPKLIKYGENVLGSTRFNEQVSDVKSKIIIAHIRKASPKFKIISDRNAQPFTYKNWIFAHNGTLNREGFINILNPPYNENLTSQPIDSEIYFRLLLQNINKNNDIIEGIKETILEVNKCANGTNFLLTNGNNLWAYRCSRTLFYLLREKENTAIQSVKEAGIIISSEKLTYENWIEVKENTLIEACKNLQYKIIDFN